MRERGGRERERERERERKRRERERKRRERERGYRMKTCWREGIISYSFRTYHFNC